VVTDMTSTPSRSISDERGSLLIEVLVSAVLVAVIGVALFGALNSAAKVSGKSKTRAGAAAVAQDDQERLRATPVAVLNNLRQRRDPVVMGKIAYVVDSRADWIADAKGATDCTANGAAADYLKITSTVTAKNIPLKPVVVTSTVTPAPGTFTSDEGSLAVSVNAADGHGVGGITVTIAGPTTDVQVTDANGCAFFGYEPVGGYNVTAAGSGYVDPNGNATATGTASIASQTVATLPLKYDRAGQVKVNFKTMPDVGTTELDSYQGSVGFANAGVTINGGVRFFADTSVPPPTSITTTPTLFPFPAAYSVFAGDCANNNAPSGATPDSLAVLPGKLDHTLDVHVPSLNVRTQLDGVNKPGMSVLIKSTTSGCTPKTYLPVRVSNSAARLDDPGFPYGTYTVCVDNRGMPGTTRRTGNVAVTVDAAKITPPVFNVRTTTPTSTSGQCT
jgi:Tfp pilus assembly protein PilV